MVDFGPWLQIAGLAIAICLGIGIMVLFVYFSRQLQIRLWWTKRLNPMGNWGITDIWASKRTYSFIVSFNDPKWVLFKTKDNPGMTFLNPSNSKEDADCVISRWGAPFVSFDIRDGVHPLRVRNGTLDRSADPSGLTMLLQNMKDLEQAKAGNEITKATKPSNPNLMYAVIGALLCAAIAAYYGYANSGAINSCMKEVAATAPSTVGSLGGLLHP